MTENILENGIGERSCIVMNTFWVNRIIALTCRQSIENHQSLQMISTTSTK